MLDYMRAYHSENFVAPSGRFKTDEELEAKKTYTLRSHQVEAADSVGKDRSFRSGVVVMPCGSGKTLVGAEVVRRIGGRVLVLAPQTATLAQWKKVLTEHVCGGGVCTPTDAFLPRWEEGPPLATLATYASLASLLESEKSHIVFWHFNAVICDEVHTVPAPTHRMVARVSASVRIGLTAALLREDGKGGDVDAIIGPVIHRCELADLVGQRCVGTVEHRATMVPLHPLEHVEKNEAGSQLLRNLTSTLCCRKLAQLKFLLTSRHEHGKCIVFCGTRPAFCFLEGLLRQLVGARLFTLNGETKRSSRQDVIRAFEAAAESVLLASRVADSSFDFPSADVVVQMSLESGSRCQQIQRVGRAQRPLNESVCYTLLCHNTHEVGFFQNRMAFMLGQGYKLHQDLELQGVGLLDSAFSEAVRREVASFVQKFKSRPPPVHRTAAEKKNEALRKLVSGRKKIKKKGPG